MMQNVYTWVITHKLIVGICLYVLANACKRIPPPATGTWKYVAWATLESLFILPYDKWLGIPKTLPILPGEPTPTSPESKP